MKQFLVFIVLFMQCGLVSAVLPETMIVDFVVDFNKYQLDGNDQYDLDVWIEGIDGDSPITGVTVSTPVGSSVTTLNLTYDEDDQVWAFFDAGNTKAELDGKYNDIGNYTFTVTLADASIIEKISPHTDTYPTVIPTLLTVSLSGSGENLDLTWDFAPIPSVHIWLMFLLLSQITIILNMNSLMI
ncbi:MAG: hypothetical protein IIB41_03585 [Candidatus Marinimicrobia bacterium]|nr:hypothetical protein [Candidatus Neomarinimicrobiota bacterium]